MMACQPTLDARIVIANAGILPAFPRTVLEILATIDDPDANMQVLVRCIKVDPAIAAQVLDLANRAEIRGWREAGITDLYTATSLIGLRRVREIALISSLQEFSLGLNGGQPIERVWQHSVGVGVCCEELVLETGVDVSVDTALIAGLLHDVGQLWLHAFDATRAGTCWSAVRGSGRRIEDIERAAFGVDHAQIGAWLAGHWGLPQSVREAIGGHHAPPPDALAPLTALVHVAEVMSHALELGGSHDTKVTQLSGAACRRLGLRWGAETQDLLGRMEARAQHANAFFVG